MSEALANWLKALGLGQYIAAFVENDIDLPIVAELSEDDLKALGLSLGHRRVFQKAVRALSTADQAAPVPAPAMPLEAEDDANLAAWERHPGERKPVTLLFADITGSTALTETLDAEETHELLYGATQRMCSAVEHNQGTVCRFMGDGVMAMFGAPVASEQHAVDACEAALEMQQRIRDYANHSNAGGLQIRVGLHSGEVVVLTVGDDDKLEYDASGPAVPIAARMEQSAKPGEIYISDSTRSLAGHRIDAQSLQPITVKGISKPVSVFALRRVRSAQEVSGDLGGTSFVGRREELGFFKALLDRYIDDGQGQTLYLRGEPGVGKTRLVEEFLKLAEAKQVSIHRSLVLPFGVGKGQDAIQTLVSSLLGVNAASDETVRRRAAEAALAAGRLDADSLVFLYELLDVSQSTQQRAIYEALDDTQRTLGKQSVTSKLLHTASELHPVLVVIENIHWASTTTLAYLAALAKTAAHCRALLVMTSRIDGDQLDRRWRSKTGAGAIRTLDLQPLQRQDATRLLSQFIDASSPLADGCLQRAAGNPLFLEQLIRMAMAGVTENLPDSIQSLILARLDRLEPLNKQALQAASVIGQRFDIDLLCYLLESQDYSCDALVEHNLVRPEETGYLFSHALIQEGVYHSLLKRPRAQLHLKAADWFADTDTALYAQHLDKAGDERAPRAYLYAAQERLRRYDYEAALSLIERGLALTPMQSDQHGLTCLKASLLLDMGNVEAAIALYELADQNADDDNQRFDAWMGLAACRRMTTEYERALDWLAKCEPLALRQELTLGLSRLHHLRGNLYFPLGKIDGCKEQHERALKYAREANSAEDEARALGGLGDADYARGRMRSAYEALHMCVEKCEAHGLGRIAVANRSLMGNCQLFLSNCKQALHDSLQAVRGANTVSHDRAEMSALIGVCNAAFELCDSAQLKANAERGLALAEKLKASIWQSVWNVCLSQAFYLQDHQDRALEALEIAIRDKSAHSFVGAKAYGLLAMMSSDPETLDTALTEGERLLEEGTIGVSHLFYYRFAIEACLQAQQWSRAKGYAEGLAQYTVAEPLPWSDFFIARGHALAAFGSGNRDTETLQALIGLREEAQRVELQIAIPALTNAISTIGTR